MELIGRWHFSSDLMAHVPLWRQCRPPLEVGALMRRNIHPVNEVRISYRHVHSNRLIKTLFLVRILRSGVSSRESVVTN